jgi:hypothetical protein
MNTNLYKEYKETSVSGLLTHSGQLQDLFILCALDGKRAGSYLEIGAGDPIYFNNTYLLESKFNWNGISLDLNKSLVDKWSVRRNRCICVDATTIDYTDLIEEHNIGPHIDYLQLDIDPAHQTLQALKAIDFNKYSFSVITYEHDARGWDSKYFGWPSTEALLPDQPLPWREEERSESRDILSSLGYTRVHSDVQSGDVIFEDWYVNEKHMRSDNWKQFIGNNWKMDALHVSVNTINIIRDLLKKI